MLPVRLLTLLGIVLDSATRAAASLPGIPPAALRPAPTSRRGPSLAPPIAPARRRAQGEEEDDAAFDRAGDDGEQRRALEALYRSTNGTGWSGADDGWMNDSISYCEWEGVNCCEECGSSEKCDFCDTHDVLEIYLTKKRLTGSIPSEIRALVNLVTLYLSNNQLTGSIPSEIGSLVNLDYMDLSRNQLTGSIPSGIGALVNLTGLALYTNQLTGSIPSEIGSLVNLEELYLSENQLTGSIPSEIGALVNLHTMHLDENQLTGSSDAASPDPDSSSDAASLVTGSRCGLWAVIFAGAVLCHVKQV